MKHTILTIFILFLFDLAWSQDSKKIIETFIKVNEVQYEVIGYEKSELYRLFEKLRDNSDLEYLIELTTHENHIVKCYASWALAGRDYTQIADVFKSFLAKDDTFTEHRASNCFQSICYQLVNIWSENNFLEFALSMRDKDVFLKAHR